MRDWREEVRQRLRGARLGPAAEAEIVEELAQHVEDRFTELRAQGVSEEEAELTAYAELEEDGVLGPRVRAATPRAASPPVPVGAESLRGRIASVWDDVRFGARLLRRAPAFTAVAMLVIALGIGANTAIFSVINSVLLRPMPGVESPGELTAVYTSDYSGPRYGASSYPDFEAIRDAGVFASVAAHAPRPFSLVMGERSERVLGEAVSANYFSVLGVRPAAGRFFLAEEGGAPNTSSAVVISEALWREHFGGSRDAIGEALRLNGQVLTIVGIAPEAFRGSMRGIRVDAWIPLSAPEAILGYDLSSLGNRGLMLTGRLPAGTTVAAAQARLNVIASQRFAAYPDFWTDINNQARVLTVLDESAARVPRQMRSAILGLFGLLMTVVGIVLLIACTNVANLMLSRASSRRAEMGVRIAMGATRGRIVRHLLAESLLLAGLGGAAGVLLAYWLTSSINAISLPVPIPFALDVALDVRVVAFAAAITVATGLLFGLLPAIQASRAPAPMLRGSGYSGAPRMRLRNALVVVQVAASLVLLVGGGLFLRSLVAAQRVDVGFDPDNMALVGFDLETEGYSTEAAQRFYTDFEERVRALPGVTAVTMAEMVPLGMGWARRGIAVQGYTPAEGEDMEVPFNGVGPDYFDAMKIPMARGRGFTRADRDGAPPVVVVNESFARRFWPGEDPLGKGVSMNGTDGPFGEVVGVVRDGKYRSLTEEPVPYIYYPHLQRPTTSMTVQIRTGGDPSALVPALRREVRAAAPNLPMPSITTLRQHIGLATLPQRIAAIMLAALGALALAISVVGLYGVVAYAVTQRTREFGIRMALGALTTDVRTMVIKQGVTLALIGTAIGTVIAIFLARLIRGMLLVPPVDAVTFIAVPLLLTAAAALASYFPARRATRVSPVTALKGE